MGFMKRNSHNNELAGGRETAYRTLSGPAVLDLRGEAQAHGVEWHHAAGHSSGREVISFFPKNAEEEAKVDRLAEAVAADKATRAKEAKALKARGWPTSKAAVWRYLEKHGQKDAGFGGVDYKDGKYGKFVCSFGEPDGHLFFDSPEIAEIAKKKLGI